MDTMDRLRAGTYLDAARASRGARPGKAPRGFRPVRAGLLLAVALLATIAGAQAAAAAEVTYLDHPAQIRHKGAVEWVRLNLGDTVREGDFIRTGTGGRVEVLIEPKRLFRVGQATEIELPDFSSKGGMKTRVNVLLGRMWANIGTPLKEAAGESFQVTTKTATVGIKGTRFGVDYDKAQDISQVSVVEGVVAAMPPEVKGITEIEGPREIAPPQEISQTQWQVLVQRDQKVIIRAGQVPQVVPMTAEDKADEWIAFNMQRDQAQGAR
jgi:hypothetical protein